MTARFHAFATAIVLLGPVAVADAQSPDRQMTVFVTAALDAAAAQAGTKNDAATPKDLIGSVVDVKDAISGAGMRGRRKHLVLVGTASEAQLIVEIRGRRSNRGPGLFGRDYILVFALKQGAERERVLEASGKGSWKVAGAVVATMVDEFARDHGAVPAKAGAAAR
jgi:hypothetical protein